MKKLILFFSIIVLGCVEERPNNIPTNDSTDNTTVDGLFINPSVIEEEEEDSILISKDPLPNKRFGKSEIINSKFDAKLIFGIWTSTPDAPSCEFEINEKRLAFCDYDGDPDRLYKINYDSIFLDNPTLIFKGKIIKVNYDTLVIHWQENKTPETLLKWKD